MLKELEIVGFKSFAKKVVLEFKTSISAIVGPNGSGKSNVAEALRFVLGEQSIKSMRGKKGEDLIFNGTAKMQRSNRASVKIIFDNSKKVFNFDYDEVSIERVVHRDGTNSYLINGTEVRLRDVLELLSGANIGASGHHIISQGEADRILSVSPKERKAIIEDALGLKIYQYKKEESIRKLQKTEENIKQVESLRREIAPHLKFLKKQVEKIEKLELMKDSLKKLYVEYFRRESWYLDFHFKKIRDQKKAPESELEKLDNELKSAKELIESGNNNSQMHELSLLEKNVEDKRRSTSDLERELGRLEGEILSAEKNLARQKDFLAKHETTTVALSDVKMLGEEIDEISKEAHGEQDIFKLQAVIRKIKEAVSYFLTKSLGPNKSNDEILDSISKEIEVLNNKKIDLDKRLADEKNALTLAESAYSSKRGEIEREKDSYKDAEKEIYRIMAKQNELRSILNSHRLFEDKLILEKEEYERELTEAVVLVGREAVNYDDVEIIENGVTLRQSDVAEEDRRVQDSRKKEIEKIKIRIEDQGVSGEADLMKEYKDTEERDAFLEKELTDLNASAVSLGELIKDLEEKLDIEFKTGVQKINLEFKRFFSMMFGGGEAGLTVIAQTKRKKKDTDIDFDMDEETVGEEEETEEGIEVAISLPHKKIKGLMMLSGGERALTSIALLFAISQVNPPPFVVLDETDAALDEANSRKYAEMVRALSTHSQIILITHNRETMNSAGVLYGVTMGSDGVSKLLSVSFDDASAYAK